MIDSHLYKVRNAKRLRTIGKTWQATADALDISIPTARKLVAEYWERHKAGTLFADQDSKEDDMWHLASIQVNRRA